MAWMGWVPVAAPQRVDGGSLAGGGADGAARRRSVAAAFGTPSSGFDFSLLGDILRPEPTNIAEDLAEALLRAARHVAASGQGAVGHVA